MAPRDSTPRSCHGQGHRSTFPVRGRSTSELLAGFSGNPDATGSQSCRLFVVRVRSTRILYTSTCLLVVERKQTGALAGGGSARAFRVCQSIARLGPNLRARFHFSSWWVLCLTSPRLDSAGGQVLQPHTWHVHHCVGHIFLLGRAEFPGRTAIHSGLARALCRRPRWRPSRLLLLFGEYTFVICLMNTMVTGLGKGLLIKMDAWAGLRFALFALLLLLGGLFVPIILKTCVFSKIPSLDRITDQSALCPPFSQRDSNSFRIGSSLACAMKRPAVE